MPTGTTIGYAQSVTLRFRLLCPSLSIYAQRAERHPILQYMPKGPSLSFGSLSLRRLRRKQSGTTRDASCVAGQRAKLAALWAYIASPKGRRRQRVSFRPQRAFSPLGIYCRRVGGALCVVRPQRGTATLPKGDEEAIYAQRALAVFGDALRAYIAKRERRDSYVRLAAFRPFGGFQRKKWDSFVRGSLSCPPGPKGPSLFLSLSHYICPKGPRCPSFLRSKTPLNICPKGSLCISNPP